MAGRTTRYMRKSREPLRTVDSVLLGRGYLVFGLGLLLLTIESSRGDATSGAPTGDSATFADVVAPLLWRACAGCHHPGGVGPFSVLSYPDILPHLKKISEVVEHGDMPPWPPEPGHGSFKDERRLSDRERSTLLGWISHGAPAGNLEQLPSTPRFPSGWQLGKPDLILPFPTNFSVVGSGEDVYRNFVLPIPPGMGRLVRAIEFLPNSSAIHHARFLLDTSGTARRLDDADPACGFGGTMPPGQLPEGQFGGWVPGRQASFLAPEQAWPLPDAGDLVVQLHVQHSAKPERILPQIGLYLTNGLPRELPVRLGLVAQQIELPPHSTNALVTQSLTLPGAARLLNVMPHAHLLAREVEVQITPPGGPTQSVLMIRHWQFQWQDEYHYRTPTMLPAGTRIETRFVFDNPTSKTVVHGPNSTDEMAEVWLQLSPSTSEDREKILEAGRQIHAIETALAFGERIKRNPRDAGAQLELGKALALLGHDEESFEHLAEAADLNPNLVEAHYQIGLSYLRRERWVAAARAFSESLQLDPRHQRSYLGLGLAAAGANRPDEAIRYLDRALELNPADPIARTKRDELSQLHPK